MKYLLLFSFLFAVISCNSNDKQNISTQSQTTESTKGKLLVFLNPEGRPCQMQLDIVNNIFDSIASKVDVKHVLTSNPSDMSIFYQYGVRALPTVILLNAKGEVVNRFSPGIQDDTTLKSAINSCKCS